MTGVCKGCGGPLPQNKATGRTRVWCSERCRKEQYSKRCSDCGARIDGTSPGKAKGRCLACANRQSRPAYLARRATIEAMWADGYTGREICAALGMKYNTAYPAKWRERGLDLPYRRTPEQVARILAGNEGNLVKARRVWKETRAAA